MGSSQMVQLMTDEEGEATEANEEPTVWPVNLEPFLLEDLGGITIDWDTSATLKATKSQQENTTELIGTNQV